MDSFKQLIEGVKITKQSSNSTSNGGVEYSIKDLSIFVPNDATDDGVEITLDGESYTVDFMQFKELINKIKI